MRIWIDTDIGSDVDDALAVAYALAHPDLDVVGLSTVFGDLSVRSEVARRLLSVAGAEQIPVLDGLGVPLTPRKRGVMFGHEGRGIIVGAEPALRVSDEVDGDRRIDELATALTAAAPDVVVAIGPLTNVGALALAGVDLPRLVIMGGKLSDVMLPGMVAEVAEWNWFCDPLAVQTVLGSQHRYPPTIVPAEVTFQTRLADDDLDRLATGDAPNPTLAELCGHWLELQRSDFGRTEPRVALHDPLTVATLVESALCRFAPAKIAVDDRGATEHVEVGAEVVAAVDVDPEAVRANVISVLT